MNWILTGCLIGISNWIRPDSFTLLGLVALLILFDPTRWEEKLKVALKVSAGLVTFMAGYIVFNNWSGGNYFPNTFSVKPADY